MDALLETDETQGEPANVTDTDRSCGALDIVVNHSRPGYASSLRQVSTGKERNVTRGINLPELQALQVRAIQHSRNFGSFKLEDPRCSARSDFEPRSVAACARTLVC